MATAIGVVGRKSGMTRVFKEDGSTVPVTVIEVEPNRVTQVKKPETDGYTAVQITTGTRRASRVTKPAAGHFAKAGTPAGRGLWELRLDDGATLPDEIKVGSELKVDQFEVGQKVDVSGISKGKGFQGTVKRWNFTMGDATHGNSLSHRAPGSIGQRQSPGRVFPGKKMSGHMGHERVTTQNLEVVRVDAARNLLLVRGAVPGPAGADVLVRIAVKSRASE
jgi:large subunit ribosomal protein L3